MDLAANDIKDIAIKFSNGRFDEIFNCLDQNIIWEVIGENVFQGKESVQRMCTKTQEYFDSVETDFKTDEVLTFGKTVMVRGHAIFRKSSGIIHSVKACDVYHFNDKDLIQSIYSYCVQIKNHSKL